MKVNINILYFIIKDLPRRGNGYRAVRFENRKTYNETIKLNKIKTLK